MKTLLIAIFLFIGAVKSNKTENISFKYLKNSYTVNESIQFNILNNTNKKINFYIGIESLINNEWREIVTDINNPNSKIVLIMNLNANEDAKMSFNIEKTLKFFISKIDTFRLKINYDFKVENNTLHEYSLPFTIVK